MPEFGRKSEKVVSTTHPVLQTLCKRVVKHFDIAALVGHRKKEDQNKAFSSGASTKQWPDSKHNSLPSMAIDVTPWPIPEGWGDLEGQTPKARDLDWKERVKFYEMIAVFFYEWEKMRDEDPELSKKYKLRSGRDWDGDGDYRDQKFDDLPHIELVEI